MIWFEKLRLLLYNFVIQWEIVRKDELRLHRRIRQWAKESTSYLLQTSPHVYVSSSKWWYLSFFFFHQKIKSHSKKLANREKKTFRCLFPSSFKQFLLFINFILLKFSFGFLYIESWVYNRIIFTSFSNQIIGKVPFSLNLFTGHVEYHSSGILP